MRCKIRERDFRAIFVEGLDAGLPAVSPGCSHEGIKRNPFELLRPIVPGRRCAHGDHAEFLDVCASELDLANASLIAFDAQDNFLLRIGRGMAAGGRSKNGG